MRLRRSFRFRHRACQGEAEGNSDEGTGAQDAWISSSFATLAVPGIQNGPGSGYPGGAEEWEESSNFVTSLHTPQT